MLQISIVRVDSNFGVRCPRRYSWYNLDMDLIPTAQAFGMAPPSTPEQGVVYTLMFLPHLYIPVLIGIGFLLFNIFKGVAKKRNVPISGYKFFTSYALAILLTLVSTVILLSLNAKLIKVIIVILLGYLGYFSIKFALRLVSKQRG